MTDRTQSLTLIRDAQLLRCLERRLRLRRQVDIRRRPQHERDRLALPQHDLRPHALALVALLAQVELVQLDGRGRDVLERRLGDVAEVERQVGLLGREQGLVVAALGRRGRGGGDGRVNDDLGRVRGAGVVEGRGALHSDGHRPTDDLDAADQPCEQWTRGRAARLAWEVVWRTSEQPASCAIGMGLTGDSRDTILVQISVIRSAGFGRLCGDCRAAKGAYLV